MIPSQGGGPFMVSEGALHPTEILFPREQTDELVFDRKSPQDRLLAQGGAVCYCALLPQDLGVAAYGSDTCGSVGDGVASMVAATSVARFSHGADASASDVMSEKPRTPLAAELRTCAAEPRLQVYPGRRPACFVDTLDELAFLQQSPSRASTVDCPDYFEGESFPSCEPHNPDAHSPASEDDAQGEASPKLDAPVATRIEVLPDIFLHVPPISPDQAAPSSSAVSINVYHVSKSEVVEAYNRMAGDLGIGGVFHVAVQLRGVEWSFGYGEQGSGVTSRRPHKDPFHTFYKSVELGVTAVTSNEFNDIIRRVAEDWTGPSYHFLRRNCCHFAQELVQLLGCGPLPGWISELGGRAQVLFDPIEYLLAPFTGLGGTLPVFSVCSMSDEHPLRDDLGIDPKACVPPSLTVNKLRGASRRRSRVSASI
eukprot:TRINITY_DN103097_c0_g1_i1.p1 TRINITY_DN103097_c0_g1~~TRINITY_DN103097_c0_g1_i1.p1  ORF type:complete len:425 (-),score=58.47 TRINITY_DN103097_c0_g1_i1:198-1472(-)